MIMLVIKGRLEDAKAALQRHKLYECAKGLVEKPSSFNRNTNQVNARVPDDRQLAVAQWYCEHRGHAIPPGYPPALRPRGRGGGVIKAAREALRHPGRGDSYLGSAPSVRGQSEAPGGLREGVWSLCRGVARDPIWVGRTVC